MRVASSAYRLSTRRRVAVASILACIAAAGFASQAQAEDAAACKALQDAMIANTKTPYHSYASITFAYAAPMTVAHRNLKMPEAQSSEMIFTGQAVYFRLLPHKWQALPGSLAEFEDSIRGSVSDLKNCKHLADETVNGETTSVYRGDSAPQDRLVHTTVWVSSKGVPLKSETDIEIGHSEGGDFVRQHISTRYEYGVIQAPALD